MEVEVNQFEVHRCLLTGIPFESSTKLPTVGRIIEYEFAPVGVVKIGSPTRNTLDRTPSIERHVLAGICRNAFENNEEPPLIDGGFLTSDFKRIFKVPASKKEKARHLLKWLYSKGGNDLAKFQLNSTRDRTLTYSKDDKEFNDIVEYLGEKHIKVGHSDKSLSDSVDYLDVQLTDLGIKEVEAELPKIPLIGLVVQEITTGDATVDENINHAKRLFFESDSKENKRSACETLSYVLEPLREGMKEYFASKDVNDFFQIVNTFDIRHNKEFTKNIEHVEQLEWVFYTLLNSINTYVKLKGKI